MEKRKRVGIMGGTFNPIHLGHMIVAEQAYEQFELDEILFVPCNKSKMKECALDAKTRISMIGEGIQDNSHFALSTIEVDREGYSYTYETIAELKQRNPHTDYFVIVGADSLVSMDQWQCPEKIFSEVTVIVAARQGVSHDELLATIEKLKSEYKGTDIRILPINSVDVSSTVIRNRVKAGKSIRYMCHYKVIEYINKNHIYMEEE